MGWITCIWFCRRMHGAEALYTDLPSHGQPQQHVWFPSLRSIIAFILLSNRAHISLRYLACSGQFAGSRPISLHGREYVLSDSCGTTVGMYSVFSFDSKLWGCFMNSAVCFSLNIISKLNKYNHIFIFFNRLCLKFTSYIKYIVLLIAIAWTLSTVLPSFCL